MSSKGIRYTQNEIDKLASMYSDGISVYKICKVLNRSETSVKNHLKRLGLFIPTEVILMDTEELNLNWVYWIFIPLFIFKANTNPLELILYMLFL